MKKINLNFNYDLLSNGAIFVILGVTPLFFSYFYPISIDLSKLVLFRIFTLVLLFAVAWNLMNNKFEFISGGLRKILPLALLFIYLIISLPFSIDISYSWFGSYSRQEGLSSWLFYLLWTSLLILHLNVNRDKALLLINSFLKVVAWSGLLASIYALLQIFGIDFVSWSEPAKITGRAFSFLGQPNYLACWLVLILPINLYLAKKSLKKNKRIFWLLVFIIQFLALITTSSRAAFLVFIGTSFLMSWYFLFKEKKVVGKKISLFVFASLLMFTLFSSFLFITNKERLLEVFDLKKGSLAVRINLWETGLDAFLKKPLLGYGLENQKEAYIKYYQTDFALYAKPNTYSDRAHNIVIDTLMSSGILGLLVFSYFIYWIFSNLKKGLKDDNYKYLSFFLLWSLTAYLLSLLFNFSVTVTNIYFWFIVALSVVVSNSWIIVVKERRADWDLPKIVFVLSFALILAYGSFTELKKIQAEYYHQQTLSFILKKDYFMALVFKDYLDNTKPELTINDYYNQSIALRFLESLPEVSDKTAVFAIKKSLTAISLQMKSDNFENQFVKAFILGVNGKIYESGKIFQELSLISPDLPKIYLAWGDSLMLNHDYEGSKIMFEKALSLLPSLDDPYLFSDQEKYLNIYYKQIERRLQKINLLK